MGRGCEICRVWGIEVWVVNVLKCGGRVTGCVGVDLGLGYRVWGAGGVSKKKLLSLTFRLKNPKYEMRLFPRFSNIVENKLYSYLKHTRI